MITFHIFGDGLLLAALREAFQFFIIKLVHLFLALVFVSLYTLLFQFNMSRVLATRLDRWLSFWLFLIWKVVGYECDGHYEHEQ